MEVVQSFGVPLVNCPRFAYIMKKGVMAIGRVECMANLI